MEPIRILIVDDHQVVREGLASILTARYGLEVAGEASSGQEAVRLATELEPDIILMDLNMAEMDGIEATRAIKASGCSSAILVLSSFNEGDQINAIMSAGAAGYLLKESSADQLISAIQSVHGGQTILSPSVMETITSQPAARESASTSVQVLTERELDVLQGIVDGLTNEAIGVRLNIRATTVRAHVSSILLKLNVTNRTQAAMVAREMRLL